MTDTRHYSGRGVTETVTYLGYTIVLGHTDLDIFTPDGKQLVSGRLSLETARKVVRDHRLAGRLVAREREEVPA